MPASEHTFRKLVNLLVPLLEEGAARLLVRAPIGDRFIWTTFDLEHPAMAELGVLLASSPDAGQALDEVEIILSDATLTQLGPRALTYARPSGADTQDDEGLDEVKYALVAESLPLDELRRRVWVKRTAKTHLLLTADWELALKLEDDDVATPAGTPAPFALVRMQGTRLDDSEETPSDEVLLTVDEEDVDFLLSTLGRLKTSLVQLRRDTP